MLSDSRFELGIGSAWHVPEFRATGIPFDRPGVRIERLAEAITVIKGLWGEGPFSFSGEHYTIEGLDGTPKPRAVPLMIGGGARRMLELAGREADIVSLAAHVKPDGNADTTTYTARAVEERLGWVRAAAGARDVELSNYYSTPAVIGARDDAIATIMERLGARWGEHGLTPEDIAESPHYLVGDVREMIDTLVERRARFGFSYVVFTGDVEQYAPIVSALAGT